MLFDQPFSQVADLIQLKIESGELDRADLPYAAIVARRTGRPELVLKILHKFVFPTKEDLGNPSTAEIAEYAASLAELGRSKEASKLFGLCNPKEYPRTLYYQIQYLFQRWDWNAALPLIEQYLELVVDDKRLFFSGKVRLMEAYLHGKRDYGKAIEISESLLKETQEGFPDLERDTLHLLVQTYALKGDLNSATQSLSENVKHLKNDLTFDIKHEKWSAILEHLKNPSNDLLFNKLNSCAYKFAERKAWENVRGCHYYKGIFGRNSEVLKNVYFGTPYKTFKIHLEKDCQTFEIPFSGNAPNHLWNISGEEGFLCELAAIDGTNSVSPGKLKSGMSLQRLLEGLCSDFFRPLHLSELHEIVYPESFFNPNSSPEKIRQIIKRLRAWISSYQIPLIVAVSDGCYSISSQSKCRIKVEQAKKIQPRLKLPLSRLQLHFGGAQFSSKQAESVLTLPGRSTRRLLQNAVVGGYLIRLGENSQTRYQVK